MNKEVPKPPHIIHGDPSPRGAYPTHTHGLDTLNWPEFFINAEAFGIQDNAHVINELYVYFYFNPSEMKKLKDEKYIEIQLWPKHDMVICLRIVEKEFLGVKKAYTGDRLSKFGYAQIFVKGDHHVLNDSWYENVADPSGVCTCPNPLN